MFERRCLLIVVDDDGENHDSTGTLEPYLDIILLITSLSL